VPSPRRRQLIPEDPLPDGIDWGKITVEIRAKEAVAYWEDHCIATVVRKDGEDRLKSLACLKEAVRRQKQKYAGRPAGARASLDLDKLFEGYAAALSR
jgi:hypothetical protein